MAGLGIGGGSSSTSGPRRQHLQGSTDKSGNRQHSQSSESGSGWAGFSGIFSAFPFLAACSTIETASPIPKSVSESEPEKDRINLIGENHEKKNREEEKISWEKRGFTYRTEEDVEQRYDEGKLYRHFQLISIISDSFIEISEIIHKSKEKGNEFLNCKEEKKIKKLLNHLNEYSSLRPNRNLDTYFFNAHALAQTFIKHIQKETSFKNAAKHIEHLNDQITVFKRRRDELMIELNQRRERIDRKIKQVSNIHEIINHISYMKSIFLLEHAENCTEVGEIWVLGFQHTKDIAMLRDDESKPRNIAGHIKLIQYED